MKTTPVSIALMKVSTLVHHGGKIFLVGECEMADGTKKEMQIVAKIESVLPMEPTDLPPSKDGIH